MIGVEHHELAGAIGHVETAGEGRPLLCVHTAGQTALQWREVLRELPEHGYRVIAPDLPGHGRSDLLPGGAVRDLEVYCDWLVELLMRMDAEDPIVVGCSIGGKIALGLAAEPRLRTAGAIAMAADAWNTRLSVRGLEFGLEDSASPSRTDRTYFGTLGCIGRTVPPERASAIAARHRREDPQVSTADLIGWATHDLRERLGDIGCPVRVVVGDDDFWLDPADAEWAAAQIHSGAFELLEGIGHYPMEEIPDFPQLLLGWLDELTVREGRAEWTTSKP